MPDYLTATEAARRLGVSRQTLYAYVSRGLIAALPADDPRQSRYLATAIEALGVNRKRGRKPREIAKAALDWGMPVLESGLTLIENGQLHYRGRNAVELSQTASLEDIAALLWQLPRDSAFPRRAPEHPKAYAAMLGFAGHAPANETLLPLFAVAARDDATAAWRGEPDQLARGAGDLVRVLTAVAIRQAPQSTAIHKQLAAAWKISDAGAGLIRQALVLCADHELNVSSFTARCVASAGTSLKASIVGALSALGGIRHGAATTQIERLWSSLDPVAPSAALADRLRAGEEIPGFRHPLYPDGDVRARAILSAILPDYPDGRAFVDTMHGLTGHHPSLDFALVALRRYLRLPDGSAFVLFAVGRSVGWIAHALEQRLSGGLIRPRAVYTGPRG